MAITYQEVARLCIKMTSAGQSLSSPKIRAALGNRGSNTTILKYIARWRAEIQGEGEGDREETLLEGLIGSAVKIAVNKASTEITALKVQQAVMEERDNARAEKNHWLLTIDELRHELSQAQEQIKEYKNKFDNANKEIAILKNRHRRELQCESKSDTRPMLPQSSEDQLIKELIIRGYSTKNDVLTELTRHYLQVRTEDPEVAQKFALITIEDMIKSGRIQQDGPFLKVREHKK